MSLLINNHLRLLVFAISLLTSVSVIWGQDIENVIVETYYVSDANDATDTDGGTLVQGSKTYRVYLDLDSTVALQAIFGDTNHLLRIGSTEFIWNNEDRGEVYGFDIQSSRLDENTVALDSWLGFGGASDMHWGVPKVDDPDSSIIGGINNDGGSAGIAGGLLVNADSVVGVPLTDRDGLVEDMVNFTPANFARVGTDPSVILGDMTVDSVFATNVFLAQAPGGVKGRNSENVILIAQITTAGDLDFQLNVELIRDNGTVVRYVAGGDTLLQGEAEYGLLNYPPECGCTDPDYLEYDPLAGCDDGSCLTLIVFGCTDTVACNFDPLANFNVSALCCYGPDSCNGLDFSIVCPDVGLNELVDDSGVVLYPNPVRDRLFVDIPLGLGVTDAWVTDLTGRSVRINSGDISVSDQKLSMSTSSLGQGLYMLLLRTDRGVVLRRFQRL